MSREMDIGQKIRHHRRRMKMTQSELSNGIISTSYLSKIENGVIEPPNDVLELLSSRLNIKPKTLKDTDHDLYHTWFQILFKGEKEEAISLFKQIDTRLDVLISATLSNLVEIHKLRYFRLVAEKEKAKEQYDYLERVSSKFNDKEKYYWLKFKGDYHYNKLSYNKALLYFQQAEEFTNTDLFNQQDELSDLYFRIASSASKLRNTHIALLYSNKALEYFRDSYQLKNCIKCHVLIGISYRRMGYLNKSYDSHQLAAKIAKMQNDIDALAVCYQNLGNLYSLWEDSSQAIRNYTKSFELRTDNANILKLIPITSIMKEYYNHGDLENAEKWLNEGLSLTENLNPTDSVYVYKLRVYSHLIKGINGSFEKLITKEVVPFLDDRQLYYEKFTYLKMLADYYFSDKKYKKAAVYYSEANTALMNVNKE
ncbi:helix-turn-helix transcriptional regulator [Oceanobacillus massiliensis]|uniref:helix-turn-helix transcriptional regulator n=1 Tax=Oceanobacillus massiliensis TaxID=1465765 RepID=UPI000289DD7F|nr:helix-turn-helix transcriptional regulator [Oceanobacillus massiliensis]